MDTLTMLEMLVVSMVFASAETAIFPEGKALGDSLWRTVLWAVLANILFPGSALVMGWFRGIPLWGGVFLVMILEGAMAAMLYAMWLEKRWDTKNLNRSLQKFQEK